MRIAFDTSARYTSRAGIARYVTELAAAIRDLKNPEIDFRELAWPVTNYEYKQPLRAAKTAFRELVWVPFLAKKQLRRWNANLLHSTSGYFVSPPHRCHNVATLHDLALLRYPSRFRTWHRSSGLRRLQQLKHVDRIICVSRFTANEAMSILNVPASKIDVVHNGVAKNSDDAKTLPSEIPSDFFLFVGSLEPGKNLSLLREAYALAGQRRQTLPALVIVGARWQSVASEGSPPDSWIYLGHQSDAILATLYQRAIALVFPSLYEGFGFPILEAQVRGCPVICSPVASMPEIAGEGARFADLVATEYLTAMSEVAANQDLRQGLVEAGHENARRFSWRKCAEQTASVYFDALRK